MRKLVKLLILINTALIAFGCNASGENVNIATASNFRSSMELLLQHPQLNNHLFKTSYASSGKLSTQINHGAPYDVFLSADVIDKTVNAEFQAQGTEFTYAIGQLALVTQTDMPTSSLNQTQSINCLAIANPKLAPYGRAALQTIEQLKTRGVTFEKIIQGQSVAQAFQFFDSGACEAALVAFAQVKASNKPVHSILIPSEWHAPIRQNAVLLKRAANNTHAIRFMEFLKSETARKIIRDAGYLTDLE